MAKIDDADIRRVISEIDKEKELAIRLHKNQGEFDIELLSEFDEKFLEDIGFSDEELDGVFINLDTEEDGFSTEKELEKITSDHVAKIDELLKHKEVELLEV